MPEVFVWCVAASPAFRTVPVQKSVDYLLSNEYGGQAVYPTVEGQREVQRKKQAGRPWRRLLEDNAAAEL